MSLYSESKQLYFDFVYSEYFNKHSEFKYLLDLINQIDWSVIPEFNNPHVGRTGYSRHSLLKAMFVQKVKGFNTRELIHFLRSNPFFSQAIGFNPIANFVPSESTFSSFKKSFDTSLLDDIIASTVKRGIDMGVFDPNNLCIDSYPVSFRSFFNNKKSYGKFKYCNEYYNSPLDADFGVKPVSNSKPVYDKHGNQKQSISYLGYKVHTLSFLNVPVFSVVSPASHHDKNYAFPLLNKAKDLLSLTGFNFLADAAYDSSDLYDFVHLESKSTAFIPLRTSSKKPLVGDCGKPLSLHSHYRETKRNILRNKYVCDNPSYCPLNKYNCYAYRNFSKDDFRSFLNRDSSSFKKVYKKRTLIESIFSKLADMTNSTSLRCKNSVEVECNLSNLYLIASAFLAHSMGRDDLLASPKTLMYETAVC